MSLRYVFADIVLPVVAARTAGAYASGPIANAGAASGVLMLVAASAVSGTTQTLDAVLQTSPDGTTWTSRTATAIAQLTAPGNALSMGDVTPYEYVQVLATVGGTGTPTVTFSVAVILF